MLTMDPERLFFRSVVKHTRLDEAIPKVECKTCLGEIQLRLRAELLSWMYIEYHFAEFMCQIRGLVSPFVNQL